MDQEIKADWVRALRSGEYKQTHGGLHNTDKTEGDTFCCLGVLCDVMRRHGQYRPEISVRNGTVLYDDEPGILPYRVREITGLTSGNPEVEFPDDEGGKYGITVAELNDGGTDFETLANLIEAQL